MAEPTREQLIGTLLNWYFEDDGIADEMSWDQIQRQGRHLEDLDALGIDPYDLASREADARHEYFND